MRVGCRRRVSHRPPWVKPLYYLRFASDREAEIIRDCRRGFLQPGCRSAAGWHNYAGLYRLGIWS